LKFEDADTGTSYFQKSKGILLVMVMKEYIWAYSKVARFEYLKAIIPAVILGLLLGARNFQGFGSIYLLVSIPALFMTYLSGFIVNAITDYEIDKTYGTYKGEIPRAVDHFGIKKMWILLISHIVIPLAISLWVSLSVHKIELFLLLCIGYFMGMGYSLKPFTFKTRGIWHSISLASCAFLLPLLYIYILASPEVHLPDLVIIVGFSTLHYALTLTNQAVDYFEDKKYSVHNPTVLWGLKKSLNYTLIFMGIGLTIMITGVIMKARMVADVSKFVSEGQPWLIPGMVVVVFLFYTIPLKGARDLLKIVSSGSDDSSKSARMKNRIKYSAWHTSGIAGITIVVIIMFAGIRFSPLPLESNNSDSLLSEYPDVIFSDGITRSLIRGNYSYSVELNFSISNRGREVRPGELSLHLRIGGGIATIENNFDVGALNVSGTKIISCYSPLPDRSNISVEAELLYDNDGNGEYDVELYQKKFGFDIFDVYFSREPQIDMNWLSGIITMDTAILNLGNDVMNKNIWLSVKAAPLLSPNLPIYNDSYYPDNDLFAGENWTMLKDIIIIPLHYDLVITLEIQRKTDEGILISDSYRKEIVMLMY